MNFNNEASFTVTIIEHKVLERFNILTALNENFSSLWINSHGINVQANGKPIILNDKMRFTYSESPGCIGEPRFQSPLPRNQKLRDLLA